MHREQVPCSPAWPAPRPASPAGRRSARRGGSRGRWCPGDDPQSGDVVDPVLRARPRGLVEKPPGVRRPLVVVAHHPDDLGPRSRRPARPARAAARTPRVGLVGEVTGEDQRLRRRVEPAQSLQGSVHPGLGVDAPYWRAVGEEVGVAEMGDVNRGRGTGRTAQTLARPAGSARRSTRGAPGRAPQGGVRTAGPSRPIGGALVIKRPKVPAARRGQQRVDDEPVAGFEQGVRLGRRKGLGRVLAGHLDAEDERPALSGSSAVRRRRRRARRTR